MKIRREFLESGPCALTRVSLLALGLIVAGYSATAERQRSVTPTTDSPYFAYDLFASRTARVDSALAQPSFAWMKNEGALASATDSPALAMAPNSLAPALLALSVAALDLDTAEDVAIAVQSSSYSFAGAPADISKCSAKGLDQTKCSTQGMGDNGSGGVGGVGACSATGKDPGHGMPGTDMKECSTSGASGEGKPGTTTCSIQVAPGTVGGGCSAGAIKKEDPRDEVSCSALKDSKAGSSCSVQGGNGDSTEVDCSAGWSEKKDKGKNLSECSAYGGAGDKSFCSAQGESKDKPNKATCSAWKNANPQPPQGQPGTSGNANCSVILNGSGDNTQTLKCSVSGSHGGDPSPPNPPPPAEQNGQDGMCTVGTGGGQVPGDGKFQCSVIGTPAPNGPKAECSVFDADGNFVSPPKENDLGKNTCYLPKEKPAENTPVPTPTEWN